MTTQQALEFTINYMRGTTSGYESWSEKIAMMENEIESLRAQLSAMQPSKPYGYVREDNVLLGNVIKGQWLNKDKVEPDDVPVYLAPPSAEVLVEALRKIADETHNELWQKEYAEKTLAAYEVRLLKKERNDEY